MADLTDGTVVEQMHTLIAQSLGRLSCLGPQLRCILVQEELDVRRVRGDLGLDVQQILPNSEAAWPEEDATKLIIVCGNDAGGAPQVPSVLTSGVMTGMKIAVLIWATEEEVDPMRHYQLGRDLHDVREELYRAGADSVLCLVNGEELSPECVSEVVHKCAHTKRVMSDVIAHEQTAIQETYEKKLHEAYCKFIQQLPGRALEGLPIEDATLEERYTEDQHRGGHHKLCGVSSYDFKEWLIRGSCTCVCSAMPHGGDGGLIAIKVIPRSTLDNVTVQMVLEHEVTIMQYLPPHNNVARALFVHNAVRHVYIGMEYAGPMHLHEYVLKAAGGATLPPEKIVTFTEQQALAVQHLHRCKVAHRDLKPTNFIVNEQGTSLKLADFSLSVQLTSMEQRLWHSCGSLPFCAPEVIQPSLNNGSEPRGSMQLSFSAIQADYWSLGVNYLELVQGPYSVEKMLGWKEPSELALADIHESLASLERKWREASCGTCPEVHHLIDGLVVRDPCRRLTVDEVVSRLPRAQKLREYIRSMA